METLKNGAHVILKGTDPQQEVIVLADTDRDFTTWHLDQEGNAFWGHYHGHTLSGLIDAVRDFRHLTHCDQDGTQLPEGEQP